MSFAAFCDFYAVFLYAVTLFKINNLILLANGKYSYICKKYGL